MKSKRILVSGGAGFIASHLVDRLIREDHKVIVVDDLSTGKKENLNREAKFFRSDICSSELSQIFKDERPEVVFHYAAQIDVRKSVRKPVRNAKINVLGTLNILENCKKRKVKKIILASTGGAIYGEANIIPTPEDYPEWPLSPYGIEKLTLEKYLNYYQKIFGLSFVSLRLANVYGPRQDSQGEAGVVAIFCNNMLQGKKTVINGDGKQTRDFIYVADVVEANILALEKDKTGIFNIGTGKETDINTVFNKIKGFLGVECKAIYSSSKPGEQIRSCLNNKKALEELRWFPEYSFDKGLKETVNWFKVNF